MAGHSKPGGPAFQVARGSGAEELMLKVHRQAYAPRQRQEVSRLYQKAGVTAPSPPPPGKTHAIILWKAFAFLENSCYHFLNQVLWVVSNVFQHFSSWTALKLSLELLLRLSSP